MLVNCPKCGFSQPQDNYCAKCGVDMENFQPKKASWLSRVLLHPALHISLIVILVLMAVTYIKMKNREKQSFLAQIEKIQNGPVVLQKSESLQALPTEALANTGSAEDSPTPNPASPPSSEDPNLKMANANDPNADGGKRNMLMGSPNTAAQISDTSTTALMGSAGANSAGSDSSKSTTSGSFKVSAMYAEVETATIERWAQRMQNTGQYSRTDFHMGVLPNIEQSIKADRSIVILDRVEKKLEPTQPQQWSVGRRSRDQFLGFKTALTLTSTERDGVRGEIKVTRQVDPSDPRTFEAEFEAPSKAGWVFADVLPHQYRPEPEDELNPVSFFKIFTSTRFKNMTTQFTLLFVFDRN